MASSNLTTVYLILTGDGMCMMHCISKILFGHELFSGIIREKIRTELQIYKSWYMGEEQGVHAHDLQTPWLEEDYKEYLESTTPEQNAWSHIEHLQACANVLKRPICLFDNTEAGNMRAYTFLPLRINPAECFKYPLALGWTSSHYNHFCALCSNSQHESPMVRQLDQPDLYNVENYEQVQ